MIENPNTILCFCKTITLQWYHINIKSSHFTSHTTVSSTASSWIQQSIHRSIVALCDPWILLTKGQWCKKTFHIMPHIQGSVSILSKSDWSSQRQTDRAIPQSNSPGFNLWSPIGQAVHHQMTSVSLGNRVSQLGKLWLQTVASRKMADYELIEAEWCIYVSINYARKTAYY